MAKTIFTPPGTPKEPPAPQLRKSAIYLSIVLKELQSRTRLCTLSYGLGTEASYCLMVLRLAIIIKFKSYNFNVNTVRCFG